MPVIIALRMSPYRISALTCMLETDTRAKKLSQFLYWRNCTCVCCDE